MSDCRQQAWIDAPIEVVWELITDVDHHPEWWPDVVEVECEGLEKGCTYRQVNKVPLGKVQRNFHVEELHDCHEFRIRCIDTGTFVDFVLTGARGGTFVDATVGLEPVSLRYRVFDAVAGKRYFRRWLEQSLDAMQRVAAERAQAAPTA